MSRRVGIDLVSLDAVRASIDAHAERYLNRMFTPDELAECNDSAGPDPARLATRIAAKEATFKALRVDDRPVAWTDVEVHGRSTRSARLSLHGHAGSLAEHGGVRDLSLSLSHHRGLAVAVVIAEIDGICRKRHG